MPASTLRLAPWARLHLYGGGVGCLGGEGVSAGAGGEFGRGEPGGPVGGQTIPGVPGLGAPRLARLGSVYMSFGLLCRSAGVWARGQKSERVVVAVSGVLSGYHFTSRVGVVSSCYDLLCLDGRGGLGLNGSRCNFFAGPFAPSSVSYLPVVAFRWAELSGRRRLCLFGFCVALRRAGFVKIFSVPFAFPVPRWAAWG